MAADSTTPLLHRFLGTGLVVLATVVLALAYMGLAPLLLRDSQTAIIGYALSAVAIVLTTIVFVLLKPRVPERRVGQSVQQYWALPEVRTGVLVVWFLLEGAATMSLVGYLLTGEPATAVVALVAIVAFWSCGPRSFASE